MGLGPEGCGARHHRPWREERLPVTGIEIPEPDRRPASVSRCEAGPFSRPGSTLQWLFPAGGQRALSDPVSTGVALSLRLRPGNPLVSQFVSFLPSTLDFPRGGPRSGWWLLSGWGHWLRSAICPESLWRTLKSGLMGG